MMKRVISFVLTLAMLVGILPMQALAEASYFEEAFDGYALDDEFFTEEGGFFGAFDEADADFFDLEPIEEEAFTVQPEAHEVIPAEETAETAEETVEESDGEDAAEETAEEANAPAAEEAEAAETVADTPEADAAEDAEEANDIAENADEDVADAVDEPESVEDIPAFAEGYAQVEKDVIAYRDADMKEILGAFAEDSLVYATGRIETAEGDLLAVRFVVEDQAYAAFIVAEDATPVEEERASSLTKAVAAMAFTDGKQEETPAEETELQTRGGIDILEDAEVQTRGAKAFTVVMVEASKVKVSWTRVAPFDTSDSYTVTINNKNDKATAKTLTTATGSDVTSSKFSKEVAIPTDFKVGESLYFWLKINTDEEIAFGPIKYAPAAPESVEANVVPSSTATKVSVDWETVTGVDGYKVVRCQITEKGVGAETVIKDEDTLTPPIEDTGIAIGNTYLYRVYAYKYDADAKKVYSEVPAELEEYLAITPSAPDAITSITSESLTSMRLVWNEVAGVSGYYVYRKRQGDSEYTKLEGSVKNPPFTDTGVVKGTAYKYAVSSFVSMKTYEEIVDEETGESTIITTESIQESKKTEWKPILPDFPDEYLVTRPAKVQNVKAEYQDENSIKLTWTPSNEDIVGYKIFESSTGVTDPNGSYNLIKTIETRETAEFVRVGLTAGEAHYYYIVAYYTLGTDFAGSKANADKVWEATRPNAPENFKATNIQFTDADGYQIKLTWDKVDSSDGYFIWRSTDGKNWGAKEYVLIPNKTTVEYTDKGLTAGTQYFYRIQAYAEVIKGGDTVKEGGPFADAVHLYATSAAPSISTVTPLDSSKAAGFSVAWAASLNASGYTVEAYEAKTYESDDKPGKLIAKKDVPGGAITSADLAGLTAGRTYVIRVCSYVTKNKKQYPSQYTVWGTQETLPMGVPTILVAKSDDETSMTLTWDKVFGITKYRLYVETSEDTGYCNGAKQMYVDLASTVTSYKLTGLKCGYKYTVRIGTITTADSNEVPTMTTAGADNASATVFGSLYYKELADIVPAPKAPGAPKVALTYDTTADPNTAQFKVTWSKASGVDANGGYQIWLLKSDETTPHQIDTVQSETLSYLYDIPAADMGKFHSFRIVAVAQPKSTPAASAPSAWSMAKAIPQAAKVKISNNPTNGNVELDWDSVYGAKKYYIRYGTSNKFSKSKYYKVGGAIKEFVEGTDPTETDGVTDVLPQSRTTKYYYWIVSDTGINNITSTSNCVSGYLAPPAPTSVTITTHTYYDTNRSYAKRVYLTWAAVSGATSYKVYYEKKGTGVVKLFGTTKKLKAAVTGLAYDQEYTFYVSAVRGKGVSAKTASSATEVTMLRPLLNLKTTAIDPASAKLTWTKQPDVSGYRVTWTDKDSFPREQFVSSKYNSFKATGLELQDSGVSYTVEPYITVGGVKQYDAGASLTLNVTSGPKATSKVTVSQSSKSSFVVKWKATAKTMYYHVVVTDAKTGVVVHAENTGTATRSSNLASYLTSKRQYKVTVTPYFDASHPGAPKTVKVTKK